MLSHALQMMGAMYYLCPETFGRKEGFVWPQSKCEIAKHVTTGLVEVRSNGRSSGVGGDGENEDRPNVNPIGDMSLMKQIHAPHS